MIFRSHYGIAAVTYFVIHEVQCILLCTLNIFTILSAHSKHQPDILRDPLLFWVSNFVLSDQLTSLTHKKRDVRLQIIVHCSAVNDEIIDNLIKSWQTLSKTEFHPPSENCPGPAQLHRAISNLISECRSHLSSMFHSCLAHCLWIIFISVNLPVIAALLFILSVCSTCNFIKNQL